MAEEQFVPEVESGDGGEEEKKGGGRRRLILIGGGVLVLLCLCIAVFAALGGGDGEEDGEPVAEATAETEAEPVESGAEEEGEAPEPTAPEPTDTPEPTATAEPTNTPEPTETAVPTATTDPNLVRPGTHLVGVDIEPGLYRGETGTDVFDSCYWARLSGVSGEFDDLIANDNAIGQYYFEVMEGDEALDVACAVTRLETMPEPASEFPSVLAPGMYLVGIDIQPGRYRGEAGEDVLESCYWARLSGFSGEFNHLIANDNANGQYFVEVQPGDAGLQTACELELVE